MRIYLIGFMGAGKSEVGRNLATRLDLPFVDLDEEIARQAGKSIPSIFAEEGEAGFRSRETAALEDLRGPAVVATGGGAPLDPANRARMRETGKLVWLNVDFDLILERLPPAARTGRPLLADLAAARQLYQQRQPVYRDNDLEIQVLPGEEAAHTARRIAEALRELSCAT
ncbi:MAG TPA: shikimate kinase [Thermoanaerobaculia bacterium]|nr:shikimate kinase [Thermoanaerobaculia bacterium]